MGSGLGWGHIEQARARLSEERGTIFQEAPLSVALCYPSPYAVAMSSLGFQTIYREICRHPGAVAERAFLPDDVSRWPAGSAPLFTYESLRPVAEHSLVAFSIAYELELTGLFEVLRLSGLPLLVHERDARHPLVVAGGPLTFSNPSTLEPFVDVVLLGEAEETIHVLLDAVANAGSDKRATLDALVGQPGIYVTNRGLPWPGVAKASTERLPAFSQIVTPNTELRSMFLIEAERGCSRVCAYCVMRGTTNGGMRPVPIERILDKIPGDATRVGLVGAAVTDHPQIEALLRHIVDSGRSLGISSLRACRITAPIAALLAKGGYRTLTIAADGSSQRLRDEVRRHTTEEHLIRAVENARGAGLTRVKLYEMIGLPSETDADIDELGRLATELSRLLPLSLGIAPFVAKRNTPLDGQPFEKTSILEARLKRLRRAVKGRVEIRSTSTRWAWVEYKLAQGSAEAGLATMEAWRAGGDFAAFKRAFERRED
ncbi:MAG: B12-binding domain-containing radical SAM protein [Myxococcales bacterium]|jgi:radical SAM superfamily enzyme YgiQ (UPF0313 family)|nr:B12-binding domain-containing radical SAM protein [Myxococcales bacterium]